MKPDFDYAQPDSHHGVLGKGHISIHFEKKGKDLLKCTISDNGIGREKANLKNDRTQKNDRPQSGTITKTRIRLFNSPDSPTRYRII